MAGVAIKLVTKPNAVGIVTHFQEVERYADDIQVTHNGDLLVLQGTKVIRAVAPGRWEEATKL